MSDDSAAAFVEIDHRSVSHEGVLIMGRIEAWTQMAALLDQDAKTNFPGVSYQDYCAMQADRVRAIRDDLQVRLTRLTMREGSGKLNQLRDIKSAD